MAMFKLDARKLFLARAAKGYTIEQTAKKAGIAIGTMRKVSSGENRLTAPTLHKISIALDTLPADLIENEDLKED